MNGSKKGRIDLINALKEELNRLRQEGAAVEKSVRETLRGSWAADKSTIFSKLLLWQEAIRADDFACLRYENGSLVTDERLCSHNAKFIDAIILEGSDSANMSVLQELILRAFSSGECEISFSQKLCAVGIVLFDESVGVIVANISNLGVEDYPDLVKETSRFLEDLRSDLKGIFPLARERKVS